MVLDDQRVCLHWKRTGYWCCMLTWLRKARLRASAVLLQYPYTWGWAQSSGLRMRCFPLGPMDHKQAGKLEAVGIGGKTPRDFCSGESVQKGNTQPQKALEICCQFPTEDLGISEEHRRLRVNGDQDSALHTSVDSTADGWLPLREHSN